MKKCPYCAEEIQDDAIICKHCKSDLSGQKKTGTQTIELTGKRYKKQYLYSFFAIFVGLFLILIGQGNKAMPFVGTVIIVIAITTVVITKFEVWWHHK